MDSDNPIVIIGSILIGVLLIMGLSFWGIRQLERVQCSRLSTTANIQTTFDYLNGCYVKVNDRYIPVENWRGEYQQ